MAFGDKTEEVLVILGAIAGCGAVGISTRIDFSDPVLAAFGSLIFCVIPLGSAVMERRRYPSRKIELPTIRDFIGGFCLFLGADVLTYAVLKGALAIF